MMSQTKTLARAAANARTISRPMPAAPAVTKTRWLFMFQASEVRRNFAAQAPGSGAAGSNGRGIAEFRQLDEGSALPRSRNVAKP